MVYKLGYNLPKREIDKRVYVYEELTARVKALEEENSAMHTVIEGLVPLLPPNVKKQFKDMLIKGLEKEAAK